MSEAPSEVDRLAAAVERLCLAVESSLPSSSGAAPSPAAPSEASFTIVSEPVRVPFNRIAHNDYDRFSEHIPPVPAWIYRECERLRAVHPSAAFRAERAWEAGYWAKLTIQGHVDKPRPTVDLGLRPVVYVVLRAEGVNCPTRVANYADLHRLVGSLSRSETVCHGFPSLAEATAYCEGAGCRLPPQHTWA